MRGDIAIRRGEVFVHSLDVKPGDHVEWDFKVKAGMLDGALGESDVQFKADAFWTVDEGCGCPQDVPDFHRQIKDRLRKPSIDSVEQMQRVGVSKGMVKGSFDSTKAGVVWLRWSNDHSSLRGKSLSYQIRVFPSSAPNGDSALQNGTGGGPGRRGSNSGLPGGPSPGVWTCCSGRE
mmetsp:Transcript_73631/g.198417  ORF Transcript_73631/g.198417 Transcript_73631/m.198417 type:complete len:177 (+) Transcript_73631:741-1271(+)